MRKSEGGETKRKNTIREREEVPKRVGGGESWTREMEDEKMCRTRRDETDAVEEEERALVQSTIN